MAASVLLSIYRTASPDDSKRILYVLKVLLFDRNRQTTVRLMSGQALAKIGTPDSIELVRKAISQEVDPNTRSFLMAALNR